MITQAKGRQYRETSSKRHKEDRSRTSLQYQAFKLYFTTYLGHGYSHLESFIRAGIRTSDDIFDRYAAKHQGILQEWSSVSCGAGKENLTPRLFEYDPPIRIMRFPNTRRRFNEDNDI